MSFWSSISFNLAVLMNLLVAFSTLLKESEEVLLMSLISRRLVETAGWL